jgi:cytochrome c556
MIPVLEASMTRHASIRVGSLALAASLLTTCSAPAPQQAEPAQQAAESAPAPPAAPESPVSVNAEMVALVDHAAHELWDVEKAAPKAAIDWVNVEHHAIQLAAAGALVKTAGAGVNDRDWVRSPMWQKWAQAMSDAGMAARKAAQDTNRDALVAANGQLVDSCEGCHKEFKPDLPSEGITHTHGH